MSDVVCDRCRDLGMVYDEQRHAYVLCDCAMGHRKRAKLRSMSDGPRRKKRKQRDEPPRHWQDDDDEERVPF